MRRRLVGGLLTLGAAAAVVGAYLRVVLPWHRQWGATDDEARRPLPGDERLLQPDLQWTRAISVRASAADIWPWLIQIGQGRAGYYSYPWLEWLLGLQDTRADAINPVWQRLDIGDVIPAEAGGGYHVLALEPERTLVLGEQARDAASEWSATQLYPAFTWAFALEEGTDGQTRLIMRMRARTQRSPLAALATLAVDFGAFWLKRAMLLGIKQHAEQSARIRPFRRASHATST
ncbi:MAG TPA: hypothetical protein VFN78_06930 [Ktedonobacterales bacterium]|nr:hypothetical protein [Ktedonobacterales bacterium]